MIKIFLATLSFLLVFGFIAFCVVVVYVIKQNKRAEENYKTMQDRFNNKRFK